MKWLTHHYVRVIVELTEKLPCTLIGEGKLRLAASRRLISEGIRDRVSAEIPSWAVKVHVAKQCR
jgi:hypothetical protein